MRLRNTRRGLGRNRLHHRPARYPDLMAECSDELALIAERRRSDLARL